MEKVCPTKTSRGPLKEFSVVYTDRAINFMSDPFKEHMREISKGLKKIYNAESAILIPGSGTFGMEAVARQFAQKKHVLIVRNGNFSYRWTQIFDTCGIASSSTVIKAQQVPNEDKPLFKPANIETIVEKILSEKPGVVFAPHVETSTGLILPDDYIRQIADATHTYGGLFVLDSVATGTIWKDMELLKIDVIITAPQKTFSAPACVGVVMLGKAATELLKTTQSDSFSIDLKKWSDVMHKFEEGAFMYHATLPTDALVFFRRMLDQYNEYGLVKMETQFLELGSKIRDLLDKYGYKSVAVPEFQSPGVVVVYCDDATIVGKFRAQGVQVAGGVPWFIDEPQGLGTFRIGLFGIDKFSDVEGTVNSLETALKGIEAAKL